VPAPNRRVAEARLRALVRRRVPGARIYFPRRAKPPGVGLSWNGRHLRPTGLTLESQLHEIAHLLVAHPDRLRLPEFGLGPDPYRRNLARRVCPKAEADAEEADTCTMQLVLARLLRLDAAAVQQEYSTAPLTREAVAALRRRHPDALPEAAWTVVTRLGYTDEVAKYPTTEMCNGALLEGSSSS